MTQECDREQVASGQKETSWLASNWPIALGWLCLAIYSTLLARRFLLGAGQICVAVAYASDEILGKAAPSRARLNLVRLFAGIIFLMMIMTK